MIRPLFVVPGDQLHQGSAAIDGFSPSSDDGRMAELPGEATQV
jgi:hypothetical protein